jgi:hypothetical protein
MSTQKNKFSSTIEQLLKPIRTAKICAKACSKIEHLRVPKFIIVLRSHYEYTHTYITNTKIYPNESNLMKSKKLQFKNILILLRLNHKTIPNSNDRDR